MADWGDWIEVTVVNNMVTNGYVGRFSSHSVKGF